MNIDKKYDPTPEENRAAIEAIKAEIVNAVYQVSEAIAYKSAVPNYYDVSATVKGNDFEGRLKIASFSTNFIGESRAKAFAEEFASKINLAPVGT